MFLIAISCVKQVQSSLHKNTLFCRTLGYLPSYTGKAWKDRCNFQVITAGLYSNAQP